MLEKDIWRFTMFINDEYKDLHLLRQSLRHVYWLGGSPCSGKTSIARDLVQRYGMTYYDCDHAFYRHNEQITPKTQPVFYRVMRLPPEDLWMRPVDQQTAEELAIYREEFPFILSDLLALPSDRPVLAEGAALLPECVAPLIDDSHRAIWIVPTAEFQWKHYSRREWIQQYIKDTSNPQKAFENWMQRDIQFAQFFREDSVRRGLRTIVVDGQRLLDENIRMVDFHFMGMDRGTTI
jgi:hypothetical protein